MASLINAIAGSLLIQGIPSAVNATSTAVVTMVGTAAGLLFKKTVLPQEERLRAAAYDAAFSGTRFDAVYADITDMKNFIYTAKTRFEEVDTAVSVGTRRKRPARAYGTLHSDGVGKRSFLIWSAAKVLSGVAIASRYFSLFQSIVGVTTLGCNAQFEGNFCIPWSSANIIAASAVAANLAPDMGIRDSVDERDTDGWGNIPYYAIGGAAVLGITLFVNPRLLTALPIIGPLSIQPTVVYACIAIAARAALVHVSARIVRNLMHTDKVLKYNMFLRFDTMEVDGKLSLIHI